MQPLPLNELSRPATNGLSLTQQIALLLVRESPEPLSTQLLNQARCVFSRKQGLGAIDILVVEVPPNVDAFVAEMSKLMKAPKPHPLELVVVGGDADLMERLERARPKLPPRATLAKPTGMVHVADDLTLSAHSSLLAQRLLEPLKEKLARHAFDAEDWAILDRDTQQERAQLLANQGELQTFVTQMRKRRPVATFSIAALLAAVFALQAYVGFESPPGLMRMGALSADRVAHGEWWRLLTCTLLHGGFMHVAMNTYVLLILGIFLERIIGSARFLVLYVVSALVGSAGSVLFLGDGFSVGASGAIWGLLGAHAVLAFHKNTLFPAAMVPGARRAAVINLGINIMVSFMPHVDMSAHFFGGAAGALLLLSGLLTRGLKHVPADGTKAEPPPLHIGAPKAIWAAAILGIGLTLTALGVGLVEGQPLALRSPMPEAMTALPSLGVELSLPTALAQQPAVDTAPDVVFGELLSDPMMVSVVVTASSPLAGDELDGELEELQSTLETPDHATLEDHPRRFIDGQDPGVSVSYSYPSGLVFERAFLFRSDMLVQVEVLRWPDLASAPAGSAEHIVRSAQRI